MAKVGLKNHALGAMEQVYKKHKLSTPFFLLMEYNRKGGYFG